MVRKSYGMGSDWFLLFPAEESQDLAREVVGQSQLALQDRIKVDGLLIQPDKRRLPGLAGAGLVIGGLTFVLVVL